MKNLISKFKSASRLVVAAAIAGLAFIATPKAEAQTLGQTPTSFGFYTNVSGYFNATNALIYVTNNCAGMTNLLAAGTTNSTTAGLYSVWFNPSGTNGTFVNGTNFGIIPLGGRYVALQFSGIASASTTNTVALPSSVYPNPTAAQVETTPTLKITFVVPAGAFNWVTNIEEDALGAYQLQSWATPTSGGNITNPAVIWRLSGN